MTASRRVTRVAAPALAVGALVALEAIALAVLWPLIAGTNDYVQLLSGGSALLAGLDLYDPASWAQPPIARAVLLLAVAVLFGPLAFVLFESAYAPWHDTLAGLVPVLAILGAWAAVSWEASRTTAA